MTTPRRMVRWVVATVATAGALTVVARTSAIPVARRDAGAARLRLSWTARPERIESCRMLSDRELEQREEHMRQRVECEGRFATYGLTVDADGRRLEESVARGSGLRHDRPLYLLRELVLDEGVHRVRISFTRRERADRDTTGRGLAVSGDTGIFAGRAQRELAERARRERAAIPPVLVLDTSVTFVAGRVVMVTFDGDRRALRVLTREPSR